MHIALKSCRSLDAAYKIRCVGIDDTKPNINSAKPKTAKIRKCSGPCEKLIFRGFIYNRVIE